MRDGEGSGGGAADGKGGGTSSVPVGECPVRLLSMQNDFGRGTEWILLFRFRFVFSFSSLVTNASPAVASARPLVRMAGGRWE